MTAPQIALDPALDPTAADRHPFDSAPFIVIWEVTRACGLVCRHCRAEAQERRDPHELDAAAGEQLLAHVRAEFGPVLVVLTGGDPLERPDLAHLVAYGARLGLRMAVTPSATPRLTVDAIRGLRDAGVARLAISVDGADLATHDAFRGIPGTFERSMAALSAARQLGVETQINSSIWRGNRHQLRALAALAGWHQVKLWSVFLLVPTGRADRALLMSAAEHEAVYRELADIAMDPGTGFDVKTTAGQPFYRVLAQRGFDARQARPAAGRIGLRSPRAVNDGNGFVFIGHTGDICPSGFLPLVAGNVRRDALADVYRTHPLFTGLRDPSRYAGKCGRCEFNRACGGSRSRAYGLTGDPLASDPTCVYQPRARAS